MPIIISRLSDDRVIRLNPEFTAAYGHTTDSATNRAVSELHFVPDDRRLTLDRHARGEIESVEVRIRSAEGECHWCHANVSRFEMDEGDVLLTTLHDIRDRKRAEAELTEMARFPDMNPGPVLQLDTAGVIRRSNNAAAELLGADLEGRCFWDICSDYSEAARVRVLAGGQPVREDVRIGDRWFRLTITHPSGTGMIFVFGSDITHEKTAEQELAERARFPAMNPGPVARLDAEGRIIRANPAAAALFGRDTLKGLSWLELCPEIDRVLWARILDGESVGQQEALLGDRWLSFTLRHEPVANQVFVYGSEITELKAAERALAELARFPDMNPGPVCRLDRNGTVLLANRAARSLFGTNELAGLNWLDLVPVIGAEEWARVVSSPMATVIEARIGATDLVLTHAPGPEGLFVFVYGSDVTREKEAERALRQAEKMATLGTLAAGVAHELNNPAAAAQRAAGQLELSFAALQTAQLELGTAGSPPEMEMLLAEITRNARAAAGCSCDLTALERAEVEAAVEDWLEEHDVESPWEVAPVLVEAGQHVADLVALRDRVGIANLARAVVWQANTFRVYRLLEEIRHGSSRISEIVGAMKAYSYLGQADVQKVDVNEGIRNTLIILRSKLKEGVTVRQALSPDLPHIDALGSELNQVWTNLIDNAVYAMGGRGEIRLATSRVDDRVAVEIEDNGPGIPSAQQSSVFDAFFTTKPPGEGTGLGLHTTYDIVVNKHGGTIRLDSRPGRTCFTIELPLSLKSATSSASPRPPE